MGPAGTMLRMGQVVEITSAEDRRREHERAADLFPDLRWVAGAAFYVAHRKRGSEAACGARGDLVLAPPGVPACVAVECYPLSCRGGA